MIATRGTSRFNALILILLRTRVKVVRNCGLSWSQLATDQSVASWLARRLRGLRFVFDNAAFPRVVGTKARLCIDQRANGCIKIRVDIAMLTDAAQKVFHIRYDLRGSLFNKSLNRLIDQSILRNVQETLQF